jgi:hypothetical protein
MVGARYGDNYQFSSYEGTMTVQNSLLLHNLFRDAWAIEWRTASNWNQQDARLVAKGSKVTRAADLARQQGAEDSPASSLWNPATDGALISPFMPVPDSKVGVALLHNQFSDPLALYPAGGTFTVRLSTFSSQSVSVPWQVLTKPDLGGPEQSVLASGTLTFLPGESVKTLAAPLPSGPLPAVVRIALENVREPDSGAEFILGLTKGQFFSTFMIAAGAAFIALGLWREKRLRSVSL